MSETALPEYVDGVPNLSGAQSLIARATAAGSPAFLPDSRIDFGRIRAGFAIALHMHQPLIPAGAGVDAHSAEVISNLRHMAEHPEVPDAHNWSAFLNCYKRMGEFIPQLVAEGKEPRVMLDYSGCLLHGLRQMGANDAIEALKPLAQDQRYRRCVEWLGTAWGHAVAPSTPPRDFRLHVRAWRHHFAAIFGPEALARVRGFSPPEMALPNHPDDCFEFVRTLKDCGFRWVLVQEHSVELAGGANGPGGGGVERPHVPHRLVARNSSGRVASIVALVKTQGSDTKLVAQMQPYYEAKGLSRVDIAGRSVPQLVTQIGDGENGGVMMNEFPPKFMQVMREASGSDTPPMNGTEYLEHLAAAGVREQDLPAVQPVLQHRIWGRFQNGAGPEAMQGVIEELRKEDDRFHVEGGSWTGDRSWVRGYGDVLSDMQSASNAFHSTFDAGGDHSDDPRYRNALFHLLTAQTSCFRYWGQGAWTDYGRELCRRTAEALGS
jgi:hypothetical protein